jgi:hypothetical protein
VWLTILSDQLPIIALVRRYHTNKLIGRTPLQKRLSTLIYPFQGAITCGISQPFGRLSPTSGQVTYVLLTRSPLGFGPKS